MEKVLHDNGNSCENEIDDDLEDGEILDEEYDTEIGESTKRNTELKASKENCLGEGAKQKNFEAGNDEEISYIRGTNNPDSSNFCDCENKVNEDLEDGEILDEEYDTEMGESTKRNTELKASKKYCLGKGAKQQNFEYSWDMDQRPQQSSRQQIIHASLHENFPGFNNNRSRDRIPRNKRVITKRCLSYQRDDDRGRKRLKVGQNDEDNEKTNEENRCTFMHKQLTCKYYHTGMKCYSGVNCRFSHGKLDEEQKKKILKPFGKLCFDTPQYDNEHFKNNLEKKPPLSMQTYDQPFLDDLSDDDEFNGLIIDEENVQNDVKDQLLPEKQKELLNNNGNSCENEVDDLNDGEIFDKEDGTEMTKSTKQNTEPEESKGNCLEEDTKEKKLKYFMLPCEVSVRDYSNIPPTVGINDPRLRQSIKATKDQMLNQNSPIRTPLLQTPNPLQPSPMDIDMRHMLPPIMTCPPTMAVLKDSHRNSIVDRDPRLQRHRFDVDQRLNNIKLFLI